MSPTTPNLHFSEALPSHGSANSIFAEPPRWVSMESTACFTVDGSPELEHHLAAVCQRVGLGVRDIIPASRLEGVLLAGGYGRGEGGVLSTQDGDRPYNDMEFYVFVKGSTVLNDRRYKRTLHEFGEALSSFAGVEVEFKILSLRGLRRGPVTMFSYDLVTRHQWVIGDDSLLQGCERHCEPIRIPIHEATRLLFNRCTGLLLSAERLQRPHFTAEDADFVGRNLAKAKLALGDALLASAGCYDWSCRQRHKLLQMWQSLVETAPHSVPLALLSKAAPEGPCTFDAIVAHHAEGVAFKFHPHRSPSTREQLAHEHAQITALAGRIWLSVEEMRLRQVFEDAVAYAEASLDKCPGQPRWRNWLLHGRTFGPAALLNPKSLRYPRERLFNALALLLWTDYADTANLRAVQRNLRTQAQDLPGLVRAYQHIWQRFN